MSELRAARSGERLGHDYKPVNRQKSKIIVTG